MPVVTELALEIHERKPEIRELREPQVLIPLQRLADSAPALEALLA